MSCTDDRAQAWICYLFLDWAGCWLTAVVPTSHLIQDHSAGGGRLWRALLSYISTCQYSGAIKGHLLSNSPFSKPLADMFPEDALRAAYTDAPSDFLPRGFLASGVRHPSCT